MAHLMATIIEETSTITTKGQTTVPKVVRQALGVDYGGRIAFRIEGEHVSVHNAEVEHRDPALAAFLVLIEKNIARGHHVRGLPARLAGVMRRGLRQVPVGLDERLEGDVAL